MVGGALGVAVSLGVFRPSGGPRFPCLENARTELEHNLAGAITFILLGRGYFPVLFRSGRVTDGVLQFGSLACNRFAAGCCFGRFGTGRRSLATWYSEGPCGAGNRARHRPRLSASRLLTRSKYRRHF